MRKIFCGLLTLMLFITINNTQAGQAGIIRGTSSLGAYNIEEASNSSAALYDIKKLIGSIDTGVLALSTYWTAPTGFRYICVGFLNSSATFTTVRTSTTNSPLPAAADTLRIKLPAYTSSIKMPELFRIYRLAATDTILVFLQLTR